VANVWRGMAATAVAVALLGVAGCTSAPAPAASPSSASSSAAAGSPDASPAADALRIDITIAGGQVTPSGKKISAKVGQQVVLSVTSDIADEVHAHTGGDGHELEVPAGKTTTGTFTLDQPGSFEVESHHLGKIIVILNVS
jgi:plastocyanin